MDSSNQPQPTHHLLDVSFLPTSKRSVRRPLKSRRATPPQVSEDGTMQLRPHARLNNHARYYNFIINLILYIQYNLNFQVAFLFEIYRNFMINLSHDLLFPK